MIPQRKRIATTDSVELLPTESLESPAENWQIYRRPDSTDPVFQDLCASISARGVTTPIRVTLDRVVFDGNRRLLGARANSVAAVPCFVDRTIIWTDLTPAERVKLLVAHNKGTRVKSDGEHYLEAAAAVDPEQAVRNAETRKAHFLDKTKKSSLTAVQTAGSISRTDPTGERAAILQAVLQILEELREQNFLPTGGRSIHYKLLAKRIRTSSRSNGYIYGTRPGSAGLLSKLLTDARSAGLIDHNDLDDGTRPSEQFTSSGTIGAFVDKTLDGLFGNYFLDVHADQASHVELLVEKNTIFPLLKTHVAYPLRVPITSLRGYGGFPAARDVALRFNASGKDKLIVIYVSDLDPEGLDMPASWKKYLLHDFNVDATVYRAAVTSQQVAQYKLPPDADVKLSSTRAAKFIKAHGKQCWELDSMPEQILIDEVSKAVRTVLDVDVLNRAFAREREADVRLARIEASVRAFVTDKFRPDLIGGAE